MAKSYRPVERSQEFLLAPSMLEWLPPDHLVWFVIEAVKQLDTSAFHQRARLGGTGRRGYDPDMLVTLLVYAMAHGESSSRRIERLCETDVAFRVICANDAPDHTVLARFRQRHEAALRGLLTESLVLAARLGMVSLGVVALDGVRIAGNASRDANRSESRLAQLAEQYMAQAAETDAAEDALFGEQARGDETPEGMDTASGRAGRIERALAQARAEREAAEQAEASRNETARAHEQAVADGQKPRGPRPGGIDRTTVARQRYEQEYAAARQRHENYQARYAAGQRMGGPVRPPEHNAKVARAWAAYQKAQAADAEQARRAAARAEGPDSADAAGSSSAAAAKTRANTTDPDSRLLKTRNGWIQGYNCFDAASDDGFIISARATTDAADVGQFHPTLDDIAATADILRRRSGRTDLELGTALADAGFCSEENLTADGPDRIIATGKRDTLAHHADTDPATGEPPADAGPRERMAHRLRTPEGHALYKRRSHLAETPHAWLRDRRELTRFTRRGLTAAGTEFSFASAVTNLVKLATKGITTSQLRTC